MKKVITIKNYEYRDSRNKYVFFLTPCGMLASGGIFEYLIKMPTFNYFPNHDVMRTIGVLGDVQLSACFYYLTDL